MNHVSEDTNCSFLKSYSKCSSEYPHSVYFSIFNLETGGESTHCILLSTFSTKFMNNFTIFFNQLFHIPHRV